MTIDTQDLTNARIFATFMDRVAAWFPVSVFDYDSKFDLGSVTIKLGIDQHGTEIFQRIIMTIDGGSHALWNKNVIQEEQLPTITLGLEGCGGRNVCQNYSPQEFIAKILPNRNIFLRKLRLHGGLDEALSSEGIKLQRQSWNQPNIKSRD